MKKAMLTCRQPAHIHRPLMCSLIVVFAVLLVWPAAAQAGGPGGLLRQVDGLDQEYGSVLYAAVHSLEPFAPVLDEIEPVQAWQGYRPGTLPVDEDRAAGLRQALLEHLGSLRRDQRRALLRRLSQWCALQSLLFQNLRHYRGYSLERQMAVFFVLPRTQGLFDEALRTRGLSGQSVEPAQVAVSLSSQEMTAMISSILNTLSALTEQEQLAFVADFFKLWPQVRLERGSRE